MQNETVTGGEIRRQGTEGLTEWRTVLLTITTTAEPATDLGFLLHKHPGGCSRPSCLPGWRTCSTRTSDSATTAALVLEVDPVGLVRGVRAGLEGFALDQYVNDRPYAASSARGGDRGSSAPRWPALRQPAGTGRRARSR